LSLACELVLTLDGSRVGCVVFGAVFGAVEMLGLATGVTEDIEISSSVGDIDSLFGVAGTEVI
jgi:hypothetical protein